MDIDHIALATKKLDSSVPFYRDLLGLEYHETEEVPTQKVRAAILKAGETKVEILEPTAPDSPVARFIEKRGEGLHHIAFCVDDLDETLGRLKAAGARLIDEEPRPGVGGTRIAFVHPAAATGVLVELVEAPK